MFQQSSLRWSRDRILNVLLMTEPVCVVSRSRYAMVVGLGDAHGFTQALTEAEPEKFLTSFPQVESVTLREHVVCL